MMTIPMQTTALRQPQMYYACYMTVNVNGRPRRLASEGMTRHQAQDAMIDLMVRAGVPIGSQSYELIPDNVEIVR